MKEIPFRACTGTNNDHECHNITYYARDNSVEPPSLFIVVAGLLMDRELITKA